MCLSICLLEHICHSTSPTMFHSTSTMNLTTLHGLSATFYNPLITFSSNIPTQTSDSKRKNRKRDIIWYNLPFSKNVSTNVGRTFLKLLDADFTEEHVLHKIFNKHTVKISYICMPNLKQNIDGHNKSNLHKKIMPPRSFNCRVKTVCPMSGNCLKESVVYQATVSTEDHHPPQT